MKKKLVCIFSLLLISCSQPILNNTGQYLDLDQEYSQFKTKALTQSYLKKKMDKWLSSPTYSKNLVREIEYAKFKHPDILKTIVALEPIMFNSITANTGVTQKRSEANFENYIEYIDPYPSPVTASSATNITSSSFTAHWTAVSSATSYKLYLDGTPIVLGNVNSYNVTGLTGGTSHTYYVKAVNNAGDSANSNTINVTLNSAITNAPVATSATNIGQTSLTANWNSVSNANSYKLYIDGVNVYNGTALTYTKNSLTPGVTHTYYVIAVGDGGNSPNSNTITTLLISESPIANNATSVTGTSFVANWTAVTGATSYTLYIDGVSSYTGTALTYNVTGLTSGSSHTYYVTATNASGTSGNSNTITILTATPPVTSAATSITQTSFTANWTAVTGATAYKLYLDGNPTPITLGNVTSYSVNDLPDGTSHTYYVISTNNTGSSVASNTTNVLLVPAIPRAHIASDKTQTSFTANWYAATGAASYTLYIDGVAAYTGTNTHFIKTGLLANSSHTYYITATNASGTSAASATVNASTLPSAPTITGATNLASTTFTANWSAVTGAVSYNLYVDYGLVYQGTARTFNVTGLNPDATYEYYVEAVNANGDASASTTATITMKGWLSCKVYRDAGYTTDGIYWINPDNSATTPDILANCNMSIDGGGWTMVVAQFESNPITNWNLGITSDFYPDLSYATSFVLSSTQLPIDRTQTGFGANLNPTYVDFVNWSYTTFNIAKTSVTGQYGTTYQIYRNASNYYGYNDPENTLNTTASEGFNTLTFDQTGGVKYTWAFSPNRITPSWRGYGLLGNWRDYDDTASWTVWVR